MNNVYIAQSSNSVTTTTTPNGGVQVGIPLDLILVVAFGGCFSILSGVLSWMAMQLFKSHQAHVQRLEKKISDTEDQARKFEADVRTNYLHTDEFNRATMVTTHQLETLAERISNLGVIMAKDRAG